MARNAKQIDETPEVATDEIDVEMLTTAPDDWEFETVREEAATRIDFNVSRESAKVNGGVADSVVLQYVGMQHVEQEPDKDGKDQSFDLLMWTGRDGLPYSINTSWSLMEAMKEVKTGEWCRLTYIKDLPTRRGLNPMKDIKVERKTN